MRNRGVLLPLLFTAGACSHEDLDIRNLNGGRIIAMGHGGMGIHSTYPLDSPAGILSCLCSDADGSEMDIQLTRDSVLVAFHSVDLSEGSDMSGLVWEHTWSEVSQARLDGVPYSDHHILSIDALFDHVDPAQHAISFDIKLNAGSTPDAQYYATYVNALCRLFDEHPPGDRFYIESQSPQFLAMLQERRHDLKLFIYPTSFTAGLQLARDQSLFGITVDMHEVEASEVEQAHREGFWIALWNAESNSDNRQAIRLGPEIIQTDRLDDLVGLLE